VNEMTINIKVYIESCSDYIDFPIPEDTSLGQELRNLIDWWKSGDWLTDEEKAITIAEEILKNGE